MVCASASTAAGRIGRTIFCLGDDVAVASDFDSCSCPVRLKLFSYMYVGGAKAGGGTTERVCDEKERRPRLLLGHKQLLPAARKS